ncbi:hypothetical protein OBBRIDRAFT_723886, partial [Obba rivulosa]
SAKEVDVHMAYASQQRLDGAAATVAQAVRQKQAFDRCVLESRVGAVSFTPGDLVQIYRNDLDYTFCTDRKLLPKWSPLQRISSRLHNSYRLATLEGTPINGTFHARCLRHFSP